MGVIGQERPGVYDEGKARPYVRDPLEELGQLGGVLEGGRPREVPHHEVLEEVARRQLGSLVRRPSHLRCGQSVQFNDLPDSVCGTGAR